MNHYYPEGMGFNDGLEQFCNEDRREQQEANEERLWLLEQAIRECLTKGVSIESIKTICFESGASYARVVGDV